MQTKIPIQNSKKNDGNKSVETEIYFAREFFASYKIECVNTNIEI